MTEDLWRGFRNGVMVFAVGAIIWFGLSLVLALRDAHVVYDGRPPEENYAFFLSECSKAGFDGRQCVFLGRVGRISGRPPFEEKGESL